MQLPTYTATIKFRDGTTEVIHGYTGCHIQEGVAAFGWPNNSSETYPLDTITSISAEPKEYPE